MNDEQFWPGPTHDWEIEVGFPTVPREGHFYRPLAAMTLLYQYVRDDYKKVSWEDYSRWKEEDGDC